jgi:glycosyltransferase involved in cell wall biosynthesis
MKTHICVLTSVHSPFDGRIFHRECITLQQAGYQVTVVAPAAFERQEQDHITILGVSQPKSRWMRPIVWLHLLCKALRLRVDAIHIHDPELLLLVPLLRLRFGRRVKIVYDIHEYFVDSLAAKYWIPRPLRRFAVATARRLEKLLIRGVDGIICAVEGQKPLYDSFPGPLAVVRNLPFTTLFEDAEPHPALDVHGLRLIYVGLILPERGINVLMEAMRLLSLRGLKDIYLFLVGPKTSAAYIQEILALADTHQLAKQVRWLGYVAHDQLKHYLANADVGLVPGLRTQQFRNPGISTKLLEYMLCGLPVISVDHPHHLVFLAECNCGLTVRPTDAPAFADAILWMRDHPQQARAQGQRGRAMVLEHYTWEQEQSALLAFYQALQSA